MGLRVACLGAGYFSQFHIGSWQRMARVDLVGVCDLDLRKAKATGAHGFSVGRLADKKQVIKTVFALLFGRTLPRLGRIGGH